MRYSEYLGYFSGLNLCGHEPNKRSSRREGYKIKMVG